MSEIVVNSETISIALKRMAREIDEIEPILTSAVVNDTTILDALSQLLGALHQMQLRSEESHSRLSEEVRCMGLQLARLAIEINGRPREHRIVVRGDQQIQLNPEVALLEYLYSFIPNRNAIDIGAHVGEVSARLLKAGYTVYAFEPYEPSFGKLKASLDGLENLHAFNSAIGPADTNLELHVAALTGNDDKLDSSLFNSLVDHPMLADCKFVHTKLVPVRSLDSLRRSGEIPQEVGLLKIDAEGFDLQIIRSLDSDETASVVMAEFWDPAHPFGRNGHGKLADIVSEMKKRGFAWHIVIYHLDEQQVVSYYSNQVETVPKSWGNVIFFREHDVFAQALRWCAEVLSATVYR